jgi:hypothetical protein
MPTSLEVLNTSHGQPSPIGQSLLSEAGRNSVLSQQCPEFGRDVDVLA